MIVLYRVIPALMRLVEIQQEAGGVISVLDRVQHVGKLVEPAHMPFGIDLHAADIDRMITGGDSLFEVPHRGLAAIKEQPLATIIQRPGPGHEFARHRLAASLNAADALQQAFGNAVLRLGAAGLGQADIIETGE